MPRKMTYDTMKLHRVAGAGLEARLNRDMTVSIFDSRTGKEVYVEQDPSDYVLKQFATKPNFRAGQHSDSKMLNILEELDGEPALEDYL